MRSVLSFRGAALVPLAGAILGALAARPAAAGTLLVGDNTKILSFNAQTANLNGTFVANGSGGLGFPLAMLFRADGNLYVADNSTPAILRYEGATGGFIDTFAPPINRGQFNPYGMAFGADGNLYVLNGANNQVVRFNGTNGALIDTFVPTGSGGLTSPRALAFGPDGSLYVASSASHQVLRYNGSTGAFMDAFVAANSGGLNRPFGLTFGPDGNLYVADNLNNNVLRYNGTTGAFMSVFASTGLSGPHALAFGPDGSLYVCSYGTGTVPRFNGTTGAPIDTFLPATSGWLGGPFSMLFLPPKAPSSLVASLVAGTQVDLFWTVNSDDETSLTVWRKGGGSGWTPIGSVAAQSTNFYDSGLSPGTPYTYRVQAIGAVGASPWSNQLTVTTQSPLPAAPADLTAATAAPGQIDLAWTNNSANATSFLIWRQGGGSGYAQIAVVDGSITSYVDTGLTSDTVYLYRVRALNAAGLSDWSNEASADTPVVPPAAPSSLTATVVASTAINLAWTVNSNNETALAVWRQTGSGSWTRIAALAPHTSSYSDTGLTPATTYTYRVRAVNSYLASAWSNLVTATTGG